MQHNITLNPDSNGGESIILTTFFKESEQPDKLEIVSQRLTLGSYGNSAQLNLTDVLTPEILHNMANELEQIQNRELVVPK